jgi:hypothetical protein
MTGGRDRGDCPLGGHGGLSLRFQSPHSLKPKVSAITKLERDKALKASGGEVGRGSGKRFHVQHLAPLNGKIANCHNGQSPLGYFHGQ